MKNKLAVVVLSFVVSPSILYAQIPVTDYALNVTQQMNLQDSLVNTAKSVARTASTISSSINELKNNSK